MSEKSRPQIKFSSQNLGIEHNFFKWDGEVTKIWHDTYFSMEFGKKYLNVES